MFNKSKIIILDNKIDIVNYKYIDHFDNNKIIIKLDNSNIFIYGESLIISKLISDEVLICGSIDKLEFR